MAQMTLIELSPKVIAIEKIIIITKIEEYFFPSLSSTKPSDSPQKSIWKKVCTFDPQY